MIRRLSSVYDLRLSKVCLRLCTGQPASFIKNMVQPTKCFPYTIVFLVNIQPSTANFAKTMVQPAKTFRCTMPKLRRNLKIALEPWYRWTFSHPIPCPRGSGHSLSQRFSKKAWYTEELFSPVPCFSDFRLCSTWLLAAKTW